MPKSKDKKKLYKKYENSLSRFLADYPHPEVLLCGSLARRGIHHGSDIDIFLIDDTVDKIREEKYHIQTIAISVIRSSYQEIETLLESEKSSFMRMYSSYIAHGKALIGNQASTLIKKAKECYISPAPLLSKTELGKISTSLEKYVEHGKYYSQHIGYIGFSMRMSEFINEMIRYHCVLSKNLIPNYKNTEKTLQDKDFKKLIKQYLSEKDVRKKYKVLKKIVYIIRMLLDNYTK